MELNKANMNKYAIKKKFFLIEEVKNDFELKSKDFNKLYIILTRLCDENILYRYEQGIYGCQKKSEYFNQYIPYSYDTMITAVFLKNNNGYYSGADYFNFLGLSDWCSAKKIIVTNKAIRTKNMSQVILCKPKTIINKQNINYLQFLDMIEDLIKNKYSINQENYRKIIYNKILNFDFYYLLKICHLYYNQKVLNYILELVEEYYENT